MLKFPPHSNLARWKWEWGFFKIYLFLPEAFPLALLFSSSFLETDPIDHISAIGNSWSSAFENTRLNFSSVSSNLIFKYHGTPGKLYMFVRKKVVPIFILLLWFFLWHSVSHSSFVQGIALWDKDIWCLIEDGSLNIIQTALEFY